MKNTISGRPTPSSTSTLRETLVCEEWEDWAAKPGNAAKEKIVTEILFEDQFWEDITHFCKMLKPIVRLIRLVDNNMPSMGKVSDMLDEWHSKL